MLMSASARVFCSAVSQASFGNTTPGAVPAASTNAVAVAASPISCMRTSITKKGCMISVPDRKGPLARQTGVQCEPRILGVGAVRGEEVLVDRERHAVKRHVGGWDAARAVRKGQTVYDDHRIDQRRSTGDRESQRGVSVGRCGLPGAVYGAVS